jgi:hypothetical protein
LVGAEDLDHDRVRRRELVIDVAGGLVLCQAA